MINLDIIEQEIRDLEARGDTTYAQCQRLSWLYVVRDHLMPRNDSTMTPRLQGSEFLELCSDMNYPQLMNVINEHLETLKMLYPKSYESLMNRIRALKG